MKQDIRDQKIFSKEWIEGMFNQRASNSINEASNFAQVLLQPCCADS